MRVRKFRLQHYGPFIDSGWIELSNTMNIFVGENNSGKSAVLRSFSESLPDVRHRSSQEWRAEYLPVPVQSVAVDYAGSDLEWVLRRHAPNGVGWFIATPSIATQESVEEYARAELAKAESTVFMKRHTGEFEQFSQSQVIGKVNAYTWRFHQGNWIVEHHGARPIKDGLPSLMTWVWRENVFVFQALRASPRKDGLRCSRKT